MGWFPGLWRGLWCGGCRPEYGGALGAFPVSADILDSQVFLALEVRLRLRLRLRPLNPPRTPPRPLVPPPTLKATVGLGPSQASLVAALVSRGSLALLDFRALAVLLLQSLLLAQILQQVSLLVLQRLPLPRTPHKHWVASPDSAGSLVSLGLVPLPLLL
jgi:hypothetical protein